MPAAQQFIRERKLNEVIPGDLDDVGIIVVGGLTTGVLRALARLDLADLYGTSRIPIYVLNVAYPLVPDELREFCVGKRAVLVVEEGSPDYIEQAVNTELRRADIQTRVLGKGHLPRAGEYVSEVLLNGLALLPRAKRGRTASTPTRSWRARRTCWRTRRPRWLRSATFRRDRRTSAPDARSARCSARSS